MSPTRVNGPALRVIRERTPLKVSELAQKVRDSGVKCHDDHLYGIELERVNASPVLATALAQALGVPVTAILRETGAGAPEGAPAEDGEAGQVKKVAR